MLTDFEEKYEISVSGKRTKWRGIDHQKLKVEFLQVDIWTTLM